MVCTAVPLGRTVCKDRKGPARTLWAETLTPCICSHCPLGCLSFCCRWEVMDLLLTWRVLIRAEKLIKGFHSVHIHCLLLKQVSVRHWDLPDVQHSSPFQIRTSVQLFTNDLKPTPQIQTSQLLALFLVSATALLGFEVCVLLSPVAA